MKHFVVVRQLFVIVMFFVFLFSSHFVYGTDINAIRLRLCNLNADNYSDSIRLDKDNNLSHIVWGCDTSQVAHRTFFKYPKDSLIKCKYSLINFDTDSIKDIYINIKYRFGNLDSTYHYVILAQESLNLIDTISLDTTTITPAYLAGYSGIDSIFTGSSLFTPGSMKALTFRHVTRNIVVPAVKTAIENKSIITGTKIEIFPIPGIDHFEYKISGFNKGSYKLELLNLLNQPVYRDNFLISSEIYQGNIKLNGISPGIYTFKVYNDTVVFYKLVIIIK